MARPVSTLSLSDALKREGFTLPPETVHVSLTAAVDSTYQLHIVMNLTDESLAQVGRALQRVADDAHQEDLQRFARTNARSTGD